ncbi:MAG: CYTH and CHAD domain-containing protein [Pseudomonadota bacterium]
MQEIELKFLLTKSELRHVSSKMRKLRDRGARNKPDLLRTIYFDTDAHDLATQGTALRLRQKGHSWEQTVKVKRAGGAVFVSDEFTTPVPSGEIRLEEIPEPSVREALMRLCATAPLAPIAETIIERRAQIVRETDGSAVEIALDDGEIHAGNRTAELREVEFELMSGSRRALYACARRLVGHCGLSISQLTKAERGYRLASGLEIDDTITPRHAFAIPVRAQDTTEEAAHAILRECFLQILVNGRVVCHSDDPEGPHQLRIGLRRLRTALSAFSEPLASPQLDHLKDEARWLGQVVGELRDLDVTINDILEPEQAAFPDEPGFATLATSLRNSGDVARRTVRATLMGERAQAFVFDLAEFTETRGWLSPNDLAQTARLAEPLAPFAKRALDGRLTHVRKRSKGIAKLSIEARHILRKELKKMRYTAEFFAPVFDKKRTGRFIKKVKAFQELFGDLNDLSVAQEILMGASAPCRTDPAAQRATGLIIGRRLARSEDAWEGAQTALTTFRRSETFWG